MSKGKIIFVSFATLKKPAEADVFVKARGKTAEALRSEILSHYPAGTPGQTQSKTRPPPPSLPVLGPVSSHTRIEVLVLIDALNPLATAAPSYLAPFLSSLVTQPAISLVAVYHADVPLVLPRSFNEYEPLPLTVLSHLATAILRVSSLYQAIERKRARDRSLQEPEWGLNEDREGVLVGLSGGKEGATGGPSSEDGLVVEMEIRRRSGRSVGEKFVLAPSSVAGAKDRAGKMDTARLLLLSDHPMFRSPDEAGRGEQAGEGDEAETTFNLGLTEKQRRDREGIVLPYFDAQTDIGAGEGGRILYEMGREDDFDDEEDEI